MEWNEMRKPKILKKKSHPNALSIPHGMFWDGTQATAMG